MPGVAERHRLPVRIEQGRDVLRLEASSPCLKTESVARKILAIISGYKIKLSKLDNSHMFPLEDIETTDDGEKSPKLLVFPNYDERENIIKRLKENKPNGWVWATPGLPLLIFITAGLIIALIIGDIIWLLLGSFLF
ncbi:MAG: A24 family peptidase C-terminal domain-containing protein [Candidatus Bathyarchaeota archaeon]